MRWLTIAAALSLAAGIGCRRGPKHNLNQLVDQLCQCEDRACAEGVYKEMQQLAEAYNDDPGSAAKLRGNTELSERMTECLLRATRIPTGGLAGSSAGE